MTLETVEQIVALLKEYRVSEITLEQEGQRVCVRQPLAPPSAPPPPAAEDAAEASSGPQVIAPEAVAAEPVLLTATMVGLFHHARPQIGYGTLVTPGQVVGSIESMKVMNDVPAAEGGRVVDVFVEEGVPVEYGQVLFRLGPG